jgi:hypothetical protein
VTLIQPQHKGGAFKGPAKDKSVKADIHLTASIGSRRPKVDIRLRYNYQGQVISAFTNTNERRD